MTTTDKFVQEEFLPFYRRANDAFKQSHHTFYSIINTFLSGKNTMFGIRVTENGATVGEYTLHLEGANIDRIENGVLSSEVHTPFGVIRPYLIVEKEAMDRMILDEPNFVKDPFGTKFKYYKDATIKFL